MVIVFLVCVSVFHAKMPAENFVDALLAATMTGATKLKIVFWHKFGTLFLHKMSGLVYVNLKRGLNVISFDFHLRDK